MSDCPRILELTAQLAQALREAAALRAAARQASSLLADPNTSATTKPPAAPLAGSVWAGLGLTWVPPQ